MGYDEIALQLTLKVLENFKYDATEYGGSSLLENAKLNAEMAAQIFTTIRKGIDNDNN